MEARGKTTKAIERSHVPMRDRLRNSRGLKGTGTGNAFWKASKRYATNGGADGRVPGTWCVARHPIRVSGGYWRRSTPSGMVCVDSPEQLRPLGKVVLGTSPPWLAATSTR
jgi:hypothetical protein